MFKSPGDIALSLGGFDIHWYGITMSLAMLFGILVILFVRKKFFKDISVDEICDISFLLIIIGLISARIYYVLLDYTYFLRNPLEIPAIWNGGISIQGAIAGGILFGIYYAKKHKINFLRYADLFCFGIVTGQIIGRWGNFFNSEAFGLPTNLPWKLFIPFASRPLEYRDFEYFHPTFLYESLLSVITLAILFTLLNKYKTRKDGFLFFLYLILYSISRLLVETIRVDSVLNVGTIHAAHIAAAVFIAISAVCLIFIYKKKTV